MMLSPFISIFKRDYEQVKYRNTLRNLKTPAVSQLFTLYNPSLINSTAIWLLYTSSEP